MGQEEVLEGDGFVANRMGRLVLWSRGRVVVGKGFRDVEGTKDAIGCVRTEG